MSKKLMSLVLGSLFVAQMSLVAAETKAPEQNEQKEVVAIAQDMQQQIQKLVKGAEEEGLSKEQATELVVEKIEQEVKAMTGTSMLTARDRRALTVLVIGIVIGVSATILTQWLINKFTAHPAVLEKQGNPGTTTNPQIQVPTQTPANAGVTVGASASTPTGNANAAGTVTAPSTTSTSAPSASTNAASTSTSGASSSGTTGTVMAPSVSSTSAPVLQMPAVQTTVNTSTAAATSSATSANTHTAATPGATPATNTTTK